MQETKQQLEQRLSELLDTEFFPELTGARKWQPTLYGDQAMILLKTLPDFEFVKHEDGEFCIGTRSMGYLACDMDSKVAIVKAVVAHLESEIPDPTE